MWTVVGIAVPTLVGIGIAVMQFADCEKKEFQIARATFVLAALILLGSCLVSIFGNNVLPTLAKLLLLLVIVTVVTSAIVWSTRWINHREGRLSKADPDNSLWADLEQRVLQHNPEIGAGAREESEKVIEECLERYSRVHNDGHLMAESLISAGAHKLKGNNDLIRLCERIKGFGNDNPLDHWRDYVPDDDALKFLQTLAYGPEKFPEHPTPAVFHEAMEKWRTDHKYPELSPDRRLDALANKVFGFAPPEPIPPFRVTSLDTHIEDKKIVAQLLFQNDGTANRSVLSIRTIYWDPKRIWPNSHMFLGEDGGSMRIGDISNAFVLPPKTMQTFIHSIIVPDEFLNIPEAEFGVQIASTREISGEVQDVNFSLLRVIADKESGRISYAIHIPKNVSLDDPRPPS